MVCFFFGRPAPGFRGRSEGAIGVAGNSGYCWASTIREIYGMYLHFSMVEFTDSGANSRAYGRQLRCLSE